MNYTYKELAKMQNKCNIKNLKRDISVCIDRITILLSCEDTYLRPVFRELKDQLILNTEGFSITANNSVNNFSLSKDIEDKSFINLIYFEYVDIGFRDDIRIDFNPNTLKEFDGMKLWNQILTFIRLNRLEIRLSRIDLAFDIYNRPEIVNLVTIKGGTKQTIYLGRGGELETKYIGSSGSNVQTRLYDKNKECISHKRFKKMDLENFPYWWRLEFQFRTKAINTEIINDLQKRLDTIGYFDISQFGFSDRVFAVLFLNASHQLKQVYPVTTENAIRIRKSKLRKKLKEQSNCFSEELKAVLSNNLVNLERELQDYTNEFQLFINKEKQHEQTNNDS